ncbi:NAD(P)H-dependent glycerol-3-phosphate dehydrogenase [Thalassotalea ponticola]|uniref:NAD(P)H-dependent glycerol-3-phosphate dehydrogenase n=1 Tax=Thalassotalea ponticola TaxID=1523392 RepID=UPI0025B37DC5|nr:NAD(P)H-dependent glycerol-3-phosphate dehydrogenase [Thalassotalea ponticola]MDN3652402.1 NAD(P)H-dependent glycerol-3-phosphate dehydrogenase [Thalassotalea ponticola]
MVATRADISVIGAGSYGTALAFCLARNGHKTLLWGRDKQHAEQMQASRSNDKYLPGFTFPESLQIESDLETVIAASDNLLLVVPSHAFTDMLHQIKPLLNTQHRLAWATKGLDPEHGRLLSEVTEELLGEQIPLAVLSGPTFAKEMAAGLPTAITVAATNANFAHDLSELLHCERSFRVYENHDMLGVQLGGAVKNVIAIGAGMADGMGFGANARTALITRGLAEMSRLGLAIGAQPQTFMGMAGLGDLVLTCTDNQSRNRRFGLALGQDQSVEKAMADIGQVVEGYRNTKEVYMLAQRESVEMPIVEQIYQVLYQAKPVKEAALDLLGRDRKSEAN